MSAITFQKATKAQAKARVAIDGPSGAGKTWTALTIATQFGGRTVLIDQENGSGALYADEFEYDYHRIDAPYNPARCIEALDAAEEQGYDNIIIDSLSHFWDGAGGTLDIVDAAAQRSFNGNSYAGWSIGTPALRSLVDKMLGIDAHLIVTMRSKMEYVLETGANGKQAPRKVGMAPVMRNGVEYEFTVVADMDLDHRMVISKSRCSALADQVIQPHHAADMASTFMNWLQTGEPMIRRAQVDELQAIFETITDTETRKAKKAAFVTAFDRPERLFARQVDEALAFARELAGVDEWSEAAAGAAPLTAADVVETGPPAESTPEGAVEQVSAEAPVPPAGDSSDTPENLQMDVEIAVKGLPTAHQQGCRDELRKTFGDLSAASVEELAGALAIVKGWPIDEPIHTENAASLPGATEKPLNTKQRQLVAYARGIGVDEAQLRALAAMQRGTTEPRPLSDLDGEALLGMQGLLAGVEIGEIVFETPNGVLIAREVSSV